MSLGQLCTCTKTLIGLYRSFQDQLRRRHEDHSRVTQEHDFMRASLRESRKMQALQNHRPPMGVENTAYIDDEEAAAAAAEASKRKHAPFTLNVIYLY